MRKLLTVLFLLLCALTMCGCKRNKQIFEHKGDQYKLTRLTNSTLENDVFYVKDGSSFYAAYLPEQNGTAYWIGQDITLIPNYYKNELLAYQSQAASLKNVSVHRFADIGYTIGAFGISVDGNGYYCLDSKKNIVKGSSLFETLKHGHSSTIRIETINGVSPSEYPLSASGTLKNLSLNETLVLGLYEGTMYVEVEVLADCHAIVPYEEIPVETIEQTKNGYIAVTFPENTMDGYYLVTGGKKNGIVRYHSHAKEVCDASTEDLNISNYATTFSELAALYQQVSIIVKAKTYNVGFDVTYVTESEDEVKCVLQDPEGSLYYMTCEEGNAKIELTEAMEGKWTLNVYPKGTQITDVDYHSTLSDSASVCDEIELTAAEKLTHGIFTITYTGSGQIWGTVENMATGESKALVPSTKSGNALTCTWDYMDAGEYKARVYHYYDTAVSGGELTSYEITEQTEIIILDESDEPSPDDSDSTIVLEEE